MATATTFKKSIPYNTIRLAGDVAQWAQTEQTYADNTSLPPTANMAYVSLAELQKAAGSNIDPGDGTMSSGSLGTMRYGISVLGDISTGDGVYASQVNNTNSDFVGTRSYNMAGTQQNIRLSRLAQWDYTANLEQPDMDKFDIQISTTHDWISTGFRGEELFTDQPMWIWGIKNLSSNTTRNVYLVRSHPNGGRYSSYAVTNRLIINHVSDMNDILALSTVRGTYGTTLGTNIRSFITFGRRSSSTGNVKAGLYNLNISSTSISSASSTTANITTQFSNNSVPQGAAYVGDDLVAMVVGRGSGGRDLIRVTTTGGTISSSRTALTTSTSRDTGCDVVSTRDAFGSTLRYAFSVWGELNNGSGNQYIKMACHNLHSGISQVGSTLTIANSTNTFRSAKLALLNCSGNTSTESHFLVASSDVSGDLRLQVVGFNFGTLSISGFPSSTYQFNDSSLNDRFVISPLSATQVTAITKSGEAFVPGGTNSFDRRRYFVINISTNVNTDTMRFLYGYYDIDNNSLVTWDGGSWTGRNAALATNPHDTDGRQYAKDLYYRGEAGPVWMPILGGRYIASNSRRLTFAMTSLDYKPNWSDLNLGDPGGNVYDQGGNIGTTGAYFDTANQEEPGWNTVGRWYVKGPHPLYPGNTNNLCWFKDGYASNITFSDGVGANLLNIVIQDRCIDNFNWDDFMNTVNSYNQNGNDVYIRIRLGNGTSATYVLPGNNFPKPYILKSSNYWIISFPSAGSNQHSGNSWGWLWNTSTGETKNAVSIEFSQSSF